jgi:hypothetical protein
MHAHIGTHTARPYSTPHDPIQPTFSRWNPEFRCNYVALNFQWSALLGYLHCAVIAAPLQVACLAPFAVLITMSRWVLTAECDDCTRPLTGSHLTACVPVCVACVPPMPQIRGAEKRPSGERRGHGAYAARHGSCPGGPLRLRHPLRGADCELQILHCGVGQCIILYSVALGVCRAAL